MFIDYTTYPVAPGQSKRFDCPRCGGKNTLSISKKEGKLFFFCFRSSCDQHGARKISVTIDELTTKPLALPPPKLVVPDSWVKPYQDHVIKYLQNMHCWEQFVKNKAKIYWDLARERVVFTSENQDGLLGLGRTLHKATLPKWYVYPGSSRYPYVCSNDPQVSPEFKTCVVVEDPASACALARLNTHDGVALVGTHLTNEAMIVVMQYDKAIICLDKDASGKALKMSKTLSPFVECRTLLLNEDIKYMSDDDLRLLLALGE